MTKRISPSEAARKGNRSRTDFAGASRRRDFRRAKNTRKGTNERPPQPPPVCAISVDLVPVRNVGKPAAIFGQYPRALIGKMLPWLACRRDQVLHVCSGALPPGEGIRVDIRPAACPDVLADGRALPFADGSMAAVMLDPPYTEHYAKELYGVEYPRPSDLLAEAARVVRPSGRIVFVHYFTPKPPPSCKVVKVFGLSTGFGFPMRAITVYEREQGRLL